MDKGYILKEIKRTTEENGGIPLGIARFEKETGIKKYDWYGKYWTKWGDALKEAGYEPNRLQAPYTENWLIEQVILLIREIKRFPTQGDIRQKKYSTNNFPSHNTIRRLGKKSEIVQKIIKYCEDKSEYQDVIEICKNVPDTLEKKDEYGYKEADIKFGFIYLMKSGKYYKIGKSDFVERRQYDIGIKLPENLKIVHKIKTDDPSGIEDYWHKRFEAKKIRGEWFNLNRDDVSAFKRRKFM